MLTFTLKHPYLKNNILLEDIEDYSSLEDAFKEATAVCRIEEAIGKTKVTWAIQEVFDINRIVQDLKNSKDIYTEPIRNDYFIAWLEGVEITPSGDYWEKLVFEAALKKSGKVILFDWLHFSGFKEFEMAKLYWLIVEKGYSYYDALCKLLETNVYRDDLMSVAKTIYDELNFDEVPAHSKSKIDYNSFANDLRCGCELLEFQFNGRTWTAENR